MQANWGKNVRLPFSSSSTIVTEPFQIIHSDIWTSPVLSNSGYKYYLLSLITSLTTYGFIHYIEKVIHMLNIFTFQLMYALNSAHQ